MTTHCVIRTSPKGEGKEFIGRCALCGATGLKASDALKECPNPKNISADDAVVLAIMGNVLTIMEKETLSKDGLEVLDEVLGYEIKRPEDRGHLPFMDEDGMLMDKDIRVPYLEYNHIDGKLPPSRSEAQKESLKADFHDMHVALDAMGPSREISIAKTKLDEALMWALKHMEEIKC